MGGGSKSKDSPRPASTRPSGPGPEPTSRVFVTHKKIQNGHQFEGHVIWIVGIEARHPVQSIIDILGHPNWWCDVGHCVAVSEIFVPPESVCIKSVM